MKVVELGSFTKAAESIGFTQPSISAHIKRLEAYFDTTLLDRSVGTRHIALTENGEIAYKASRHIIAFLEQARTEVEKNSEMRAGYLLRIGASFTIGNYFMPTILSDFTKTSPDKVRLQLCIDSGENIAAQVAGGRLDVGLVAGRLKKGYELKRSVFYSDELLLVAGKDTKVKEKFSQQEMQALTWIFREEESDTYSYQKSYLESNNIVAKETMRISGNYAIKEALKMNMGIALLPELVVADELKQGSLIRLPMSRHISRTYSYLLRHDKVIDKPLATFLSLLDKLPQRIDCF